jgi:hypothetical protein
MRALRRDVEDATVNVRSAIIIPGWSAPLVFWRVGSAVARTATFEMARIEVIFSEELVCNA